MNIPSPISYKRHRYPAAIISQCVWHLDEVYLKINDKCQYLWRAVDQEGQVLDILVQPKRDKTAAERFFKKVLRGTRQAPRQVVTDRLASYTQPCDEILLNATHIRDKGANNRAENSQQSTRLRECRMKRFKSAGQAQRFLSIFSEVGNLFALSSSCKRLTRYLLQSNAATIFSVPMDSAICRGKGKVFTRVCTHFID